MRRGGHRSLRRTRGRLAGGGPRAPAARLSPRGTEARRAAGLNRSISDAGWGAFLTTLTSKAESAGRKVIAMDPRHTSRACPECGHVTKENRPTHEKSPGTRRRRRSTQRPTGRAGPSQRHTGIARSPLLQEGEESPHQPRSRA
ncbi:zinc ribbon domain-containing protein [Streptomyces xanthophaeus]